MQPAIHSPEHLSPISSYFGTLSEIWLLDYKALGYPMVPIVTWEPELLEFPIISSELLSKIPFRPESATLDIKPVDSLQGDAFTANVAFEVMTSKASSMDAIRTWLHRQVFALCRPAGDGLVWGIGPLIVRSNFSSGANFQTASRFPVSLQPKGIVTKLWYTDAEHWKQPNLNPTAFDAGFDGGFQ